MPTPDETNAGASCIPPSAVPGQKNRPPCEPRGPTRHRAASVLSFQPKVTVRDRVGRFPGSGSSPLRAFPVSQWRFVERLPVTVAGPRRRCNVAMSDAAHRTSLLLPRLQGAPVRSSMKFDPQYRDGRQNRQDECGIGLRPLETPPIRLEKMAWSSDY